MATRRVIQDSDDDDAEPISPANSPQTKNISTKPAVNPKATSSNLTGTSSTDPVLFQNIYDNQHRAALQETPPDFTNSAQLPILEDQIINQPMSSSPTSVKRLKRSRTMNPSSLTSVTSPHELQHRAKRTKSMKNMDNLTQLTTPGKQNQEPKADIWEFIGSSDPKPEPVKPRKLEKENAAKEKKTYGKLRRSKTTAHNLSSQSDTWGHEQAIAKGDLMSTKNDSSGQVSVELGKSAAPKEKKTYGKLKRSKTLTNIGSSQSEVPEYDKSSSKDDSHGFGRKRRASHSQNLDVALSEPKTKKHRHDLHESHARGESSRELVDVLKGTFDADMDHPSSSEATKIQVPRTASEEDAKVAKPFELSFEEGNGLITSPSLRIPSAKEAPVAASVAKSTSSISIVPATLTDSQKMIYENVSVVSTNQERRSSVAEMTSGPERTEQSNSASNGTPQPGPCSEGMEVSTKRLSSSPPILTASSKMKRAKSLSGLAASQAPVLSAASVTSTVVPKKKRSKTMTSRRTPQSSIDELSYTKSQELEKSVVNKQTSTDHRKKEKKQPEERVNVDDLFGSDEVGLPRELYQPRPSRRRSKSMSINPPADNISDLTACPPPPTRRKSMRASKEMPELANVEASTQHSNTFFGAIENVELVSANHLDDLSINKSNQPNNVPHTLGGQTDGIILPNTNSMDGTKETDISKANSAAEIALVTVPPVVPKRRGRPPNASATATTITKTAKSTTEDAGLLGDPLESIETPAEPAPKAAPTAKRRGRPPKVTEKVVETREDVEIHSTEEFLVGRAVTDNGNERQGDHYDAHSDTRADGPTWSKPADFLLPKSTPPQPTEHSTALPLVTPTKNIKNGPDHSPIPSSKVPYRVGLSKRSRIAPLLKMIKK